MPFVYVLEGDVETSPGSTSPSRERHGASGAVVHRSPAAGILSRAENGLKTESSRLPSTDRRGRCAVKVKLTQIQWQSVRRAEGNGFYAWDTERKEVPAGSWDVTTGADPVPLDIPFANGGYFTLEATGSTGDGRTAVTRTSFYVLGDGYTAWARFDHNRIELVPERKTYKPGETARIMIQSPWERATAIVTTEREGIRTYRPFMLTSTQQSISIPIGEDDIPNVFVSVLLVKGRSNAASTTGAASEPRSLQTAGAKPEEAAGAKPQQAAKPEEEDSSDPGKPSFRLGYVELKVEDRTKRLTVSVAANKEEYRPATAPLLFSTSRTTRTRLSERGHALGGRLRRALAHVVSDPDILGSVYVASRCRSSTPTAVSASSRGACSHRRETPKGEAAARMPVPARSGKTSASWRSGWDR